MGYEMMNMATVQAPFLIWRQLTQIAWDSQTVIALRMAGMMGIVKQDSDEPQRMVVEKANAATEAMHAALRSASKGDRADKVMAAALRPYSRRTKANVRRLTSSK